MFRITTGQTLRFETFVQFGDQVAQNVLYYVCTAHSGVGCPSQIMLDGMLDAYNLRMKALMSASATIRGGKLSSPLDNPQPNPELQTKTQAGTVSGEPLPRQTAGLMKFQTDLAGASYRGRLYTPFPSETDNDTDATPIAGWTSRLTALYDEMKGFFLADDENPDNDSTIALAIYSRTKNETTLVTKCIPLDAWATIRRRGTFGRSNISPV